MKMKLFIFAMIMILGMGNVMGQYEIAVKNDSGQWIAGNWKVLAELPDPNDLPYNINSSKFNFKDQTVSGVGGDTIYLQLVDTSDTHNAIPVQRWELEDGTIINNVIDSFTAFYILPFDSIYTERIYAVYDTLNSGKTKIIMWSKFLSPTFEITDTVVNTKSSSVDLTLADFGLKIDEDNGASDTAYYSSINWYRDGLILFEGLGSDTTFIAEHTGNYSVKVEVSYITKSYIVGDSSTKTFTQWISSDSLYVAFVSVDENVIVDDFNIYPNPAVDYLYFSKETDYSIFSILGKEIMKGNGKEIDVRNFDSGTYILITPTTNKKFIVQR